MVHRVDGTTQLPEHDCKSRSDLRASIHLAGNHGLFAANSMLADNRTTWPADQHVAITFRHHRRVHVAPYGNAHGGGKRDALAAGFTDGSFGATGLAEVGTFVCAQLDHGQAPGDVAQAEIIAMPNLTPCQVGEFFGVAVNDLFPAHNAEVKQWLNA